MFSRHGQKIVEHGGQSDGMNALVSMLPAHDLGIVVLSNTSLMGFPQAVVASFYDRYLGMEPRDWSSDLLAALQPANDAIDWTMAVDQMPRTEGTRPTLETTAYAGRFHNDLLGELIIASEGERLQVELLGRTGSTSHWHNDTFHIDWQGDLYLTLAVAFANFEVNMLGSVSAVTLSSGDRFERLGE